MIYYNLWASCGLQNPNSLQFSLSRLDMYQYEELYGTDHTSKINTRNAEGMGQGRGERAILQGGIGFVDFA